MAFNSGDWSIDYNNRTVTNNDSAVGSNLPSVTGNYDYVGEMLEFFQWLALTFASGSQMDDTYPISSETAREYTWQEGWTFGHANDFKYLKGGAIIDPLGSGTATADSVWANLYSIGTQEDGTLLYLIQNDAEVPAWWITGNIDILVLVKNAGSWVQSVDTNGTVQNGGVWVYAREFGNEYDHNYATITGGRTPIGINTAIDKSNDSGELYVSVADASNFTVGNFAKDTTTGAVGKIRKLVGNDIYLDAVRGGTITSSNTLVEYSERECVTALDGSQTISSVTNVMSALDADFTETYGSITRDLNNTNGLQPYEVDIAGTSNTTKEFYEWLKYITRYGSVISVNGDDGQEFRSLDEGNFAEIKKAPFGTLAGTTFYGATGVWLSGYASADFELIDSNSVTQAPPNYQKSICSHTDLDGVSSGGNACQIMVTEITGDGGTIIKDKYTVSSATATTIDATATIDAGRTAQSGILRVGDTEYSYSGFNGVQFTGVTPDASGLTNEDFYTPLISVLATSTSESSDNVIYDGTPFWCRTSVRRYGSKTYDVDTQFGTSGLIFTPILTPDPQAT